MPKIMEGLLQGLTVIDTLACSEANSLAENKLGDFELLVVIIIWYDYRLLIWSAKQIQLIERYAYRYFVHGLISFFKSIEKLALQKHWKLQKNLAMEMDIHPQFHTMHKIKKKKKGN